MKVWITKYALTDGLLKQKENRMGWNGYLQAGIMGVSVIISSKENGLIPEKELSRKPKKCARRKSSV